MTEVPSDRGSADTSEMVIQGHVSPSASVVWQANYWEKNIQLYKILC